MNDLEQDCVDEVIFLHELIETWLRGTADDRDLLLDQMQSRLGENFQLVFPEGFILDRSALLEGLKGSYGVDGPKHKVDIIDPVARQVSENVCLVTYVETQSDRRDNCRISTALIEKTQNANTAMNWLHLHETWKTPE